MAGSATAPAPSPSTADDAVATSKSANKSCLSRTSSCVDGGLQSFFFHLGLYVGNNPWISILASIAFLGACLAGVTQYTVENDGENLWVPQASLGLAQIRSVRDIFPVSPRTSQFYMLPKGPGTNPDSGVGAINWDVVETMFDIEEIINSTTVDASYRPDDPTVTWTFESLCQRVEVPGFVLMSQRPPVTVESAASGPPSGGGGGPPPAAENKCFISGGLTDLWAGNRTLAMQDKAAGHAVVDILNQALRLSANGTMISPRTGRPIILNTTYGGVRFGAGGNITGAAVVVLTFQLENRAYRDVAAGTDVDPPSEAWELELAKTLVVNPDEQSFSGARVLFGVPESDREERSAAITGDLAFVGASIMIIIVFLAIQLRTDCSCIGSRVGLAAAGALTVGMSLGFAYGIGSLIAPYTTVHSVLPFVLAGIGVDDLFVVTNEFGLTDKRKPKALRLAEALKHAGPSITVTTVTDFLAFFIGSTTVLPAFSAFCQWAAMAILGVFILSCTFFAACVVIDAQRQEAGRADCCCCFRCQTDVVEDKAEATDDVVAAAASTANPAATGTGISSGTSTAVLKSKSSAAPAPEESAEKERLSVRVVCCAEDGARRCLKECYAPTILHPVAKGVILLAFVGFAAVAGVASANTSQEFREEWFIPAASPLQEVVSTRNTYFGENGVPVSGYAVNFTLGDQRQVFTDIEAAMRGNKWINTELGITNWYKQFLASNSSFIDLPNAEFHQAAADWLADPENVRFNASVVWGDVSTGYIRAGRVNAFYIGTNTAVEEIEAMQTLRADVTGVAASLGLPDANVFASSFVFANWEQLVVIPSEAIQNIGLAIAACFVVVLVFIAHPTTALVTTITVGLVLVDILGTFTWWDVSLNGVSVVNLTLAIGLSVDYSAHIAHAFMHKRGNRDERVSLALSEMGVSVVNGGASTFLAVVVLAGSSSYIFSVFFKVFFLSVVFGLSHGLVFLPVVLSLIGPDAHDDYTPEETTEEATTTKHAAAAPAGKGDKADAGDIEMAKAGPSTGTVAALQPSSVA